MSGLRNQSPLVSICMPVYNGEKYIKEAIQSVISQSYSNWELIIVNDGSKDNTASVLNSISESRIKVFHQENKGQCSAANFAYKNSSGSFIKFFDADDLLSSNMIQKQVERIINNPFSIASSSWGRFYNDDLSTFSISLEKVRKDMKPMDWIVESVVDGLNMMQCGIWLIPREVLEKSGLWNEELSLINDFEFFVRVLLNSNSILFAEDSILYYRSGVGNTLSGQKSNKAYDSAYLSVTLGVDNILKNENSPRTRKICSDIIKVWMYEFYPKRIEYYKAFKSRVNLLGGSGIPFPSGGKSKMLASLIGWKLTKRIQMIN